jgi:hypothetical protein
LIGDWLLIGDCGLSIGGQNATNELVGFGIDNQ